MTKTEHIGGLRFYRDGSRWTLPVVLPTPNLLHLAPPPEANQHSFYFTSSIGEVHLHYPWYQNFGYAIYWAAKKLGLHLEKGRDSPDWAVTLFCVHGISAGAVSHYGGNGYCLWECTPEYQAILRETKCECCGVAGHYLRENQEEGRLPWKTPPLRPEWVGGLVYREIVLEARKRRGNEVPAFGISRIETKRSGFCWSSVVDMTAVLCRCCFKTRSTKFRSLIKKKARERINECKNEVRKKQRIQKEKRFIASGKKSLAALRSYLRGSRDVSLLPQEVSKQGPTLQDS